MPNLLPHGIYQDFLGRLCCNKQLLNFGLMNIELHEFQLNHTGFNEERLEWKLTSCFHGNVPWISLMRWTIWRKNRDQKFQKTMDECMTKPLQRHTPLDNQFASWPGSLLKRPCTRNCTLRCFPLNSSFQQFLLQQKHKVLEVFEIDYIRGQTFQAYWCKCTSRYLINMLCIEMPYMHRYDPMIRQEDFLLGDVFRTPNQQSKHIQTLNSPFLVFQD